MNFRPTDSLASSAGGAPLSPADGFSPGGLSAEFSSTNLSSAQQVFQGGDGGAVVAKALSGLDIQGLTTAAAPAPALGSEAAALTNAIPTVPGADGSLLAGALAGVNEPISPVIQLIMKLPGAMGLVTSFFDFLSNFFFSPTSFLELFNPNVLAQHAAAVFTVGTEHVPLSLSLLPANAPIFGSMGSFAQPMFSSDLLTAKLNLSLGNSASYGSLARGVDAFHSPTLNVAGELDPTKAVFEGAGAQGGQAVGGAGSNGLAGPNLTDVGNANHVAGNTRLFSDRMSSGSSFNSINLATKTPSPTVGTTVGVNQGLVNNTLTTQGLNSGSMAGSFNQPGNFVNNARFEGAPAIAANNGFVPQVAQEVSYGMTPSAPSIDMPSVSYGPSGGVGSELGVTNGASDNLVAMDVQSFKPTLGGPESSFKSAFPGNTQSSSLSSAQPGGTVTGLKAKQLSLDSMADGPVAKPVPTSHANASTGTNTGAGLHKPASPAAHKSASLDAPKHTAHKVEHHTSSAQKPQVSESQTQELTSAESADGTVSDGTQLASNDATGVEYTIQRGDNLWNIAKDKLGSGAKWQDIYKANEGLLGQNPDLIYPGTTIQLPGGSPDIAAAGNSTMTSYVVKPGDNLWDISHDVLGKGSRWGELYNANHDLIGANPRLIQPGQELQIPSDPANASSGVATNVDPNSMTTGSAPQPVSQDMASPTDMRVESVDPVKSMQGGGAEYGNPSEMSAPVSTPPQQVSNYEGFSPTIGNAGQAPTIANYPSDAAIAAAPPSAPPGAAMAATPQPLHVPPGAAMAATPGAAMAATPAPTTVASLGSNGAAAANTSAAKGAVVAGGFFSDLKNLFGKTK